MPGTSDKVVMHGFLGGVDCHAREYPTPRTVNEPMRTLEVIILVFSAAGVLDCAETVCWT